MQICIRILMVILLLLSMFGCSKAESNTHVYSDSDLTAPWHGPTDYWSVSTPEMQGMDSVMLGRADSRITGNYPNVYSLLVVRHGYLVYEKYYHGVDGNDANPVFSITKSVMSALTGIAVRDGLIDNTDQKLSEFFPEYFLQLDDTKKSEITVKNVLTMTGGLESIDSDYMSYFSSPDFLDYVLQKPLTNNPGEKFVYNTGLTHFLSAVIAETSGKSTEDYAKENLLNKIGISVETWDTDSNGYNIGGTGLSLTPSDMAKFGYLYLNNGLWDGVQVLPKEWVEESTQKQIAVDASLNYGYLFWLQTVRDEAKSKQYDTYRAAGMGGQYIMAVPDLDMVVVVTANSNNVSNDGSDTLDIITDYVIPAAK